MKSEPLSPGYVAPPTILLPSDPDVCLRHLAPLPEENDVYVDKSCTLCYAEYLIDNLMLAFSVVPKLPNNVISLADLRKLPLMDQLSALMLNGEYITFNWFNLIRSSNVRH